MALNRSVIAVWCFVLTVSDCLISPSSLYRINGGRLLLAPEPRGSPLYFFGKNKGEVEDKKSTEASPPVGDDDTDENSSSQKRRFFGRLLKRTETTKPEVSSTVSSTSDATELAKSLKAQAERVRLEAARMEGKLTLERINKLDEQINRAKRKGESIEQFQRELENLQAKLRGEAPPNEVMATSSVSDTYEKKTEDIVRNVRPQERSGDEWNKDKAVFWGGLNFREFVEAIEASPVFQKRILAKLVDLDYDSSLNVFNATEIATRLAKMASNDSSTSSSPGLTGTASQIEEVIESLGLKGDLMGINTTQQAIYALDYDAYINSREVAKSVDGNDSAAQISEKGDSAFSKVFGDLGQAEAQDKILESLYPKCMRKEDAVEPSLAQVQSLVSNVLPKVKFQSSAKPRKVAGGYVVKGTHSYAKGDDLIDAIDAELVRTKLADKMTVLYANSDDFDLESVAEGVMEAIEGYDDEILKSDETQILYIVSTDVCRSPKPVLLSLTTALGLATSWYLSIYPFLLNPALSNRIEEQLAVADAGMAYDLDWLTELSVPLFVSYLGLQAVHEIAHRVVAALYGIKVSAPTFVPSLITGTTSTVTTFKSLPKNFEQMFDFAIAGPLVGILMSLVALYVGSQLTLTGNQDLLPALPLDILRQSTLGGSIIDHVIQGSLYVPEGAPTQGIMIQMHPIAIAGYISLVVNALALLPIGTTDGGRVALAMFGRDGKIAVGGLCLATLLFAGLLGSDLFLFYFAFIMAFQTGNEVPARNEVDELPFSRIVVATIAFGLCFLSLVPFQ